MLAYKKYALPFCAVFAACLILVSSYLSAAGIHHNNLPDVQLQDGDIIFQTSRSRQSAAIHRATHSNISHVGIIFRYNKGWYVYEAVGPVVKTPIDEWIESGVDSRYSIKRLKRSNALSQDEIDRLKTTWKKFEGKPYDPYFEWSDQRIYCSELVWKMYKEALGIEIGHLQHLGDFDLDSPVVKELLAERYGNNVPLDETVIAPSTMFNSSLLSSVCIN